MLRTIHKYKRSVFGVAALLILCVAMSGFGVELFRWQQSERHAVKVYDKAVPHSSFFRKQRALEDRYRQMFGANFQQFQKMLGKNLASETLDGITDELLTVVEARSKGFFAGAGEVQSAKDEIFQGNYRPDIYQQYLKQTGLSQAAFEDELMDYGIQSQYMDLLTHISIPSRRESNAYVEIEKTKYNVQYVEFDPEKFIADLTLPADAELEKFYSENASNYETEATVQYDYVVFDPTDFVSLVEVSKEDVELFYVDNETRFSNPEKVKARQIQFTFPPNSDPAVMADLKEKAKSVLEKAQAGEPFEKLVTEYSDDLSSKFSGGDLGWVTRGIRSKEFDNAAFKLKDGGLTDLVSTPSGYLIIKVEGYTAPEPKKLEDVTPEIITELKTRDAPAYAASKAHAIFESWTKSDRPLAKFAETEKLKLASTAGPLPKERDPDLTLKNLTSKIMLFHQDKRQLVDVGDRVVIADVKEHKEADIPAFSVVRERVVSDYKRTEAKNVAKTKAEKLLADIKSGSEKSLSAAATTNKATFEEFKDLSRGAETNKGPFANPELSEALFSIFKEGELAPRVFSQNGKFSLFQVSSLTKPTPQEIEKELLKLRPQQAQELSGLLVKSTLARLKYEAKQSGNLEIDESLLSE